MTKTNETIEQLAHRIGNQVRHEYEGEDVNQAFIDAEILRRCLSELAKQQEPAAWMYKNKNIEAWYLRWHPVKEEGFQQYALYTHPAIPQPAAVPDGMQKALDRLSATGEECEFNDMAGMCFPLDEWNDFEAALSTPINLDALHKHDAQLLSGTAEKWKGVEGVSPYEFLINEAAAHRAKKEGK